MESFRPEFYFTYPQAMVGYMTLCVRTVGDPGTLTSSVRNSIASMDKELPMFNVRTMEDYVDASLGNPASMRYYLLCLPRWRWC